MVAYRGTWRGAGALGVWLALVAACGGDGQVDAGTTSGGSAGTASGGSGASSGSSGQHAGGAAGKAGGGGSAGAGGTGGAGGAGGAGAGQAGGGVSGGSGQVGGAGAAGEAGGAGEGGGPAGSGGASGGGDGGGAGAGPVGPVEPAVTCNNSLAEVYVTPDGLAPGSLETRGAIVRCAPDGALDEAAVKGELVGKGLNDVPVTTSLRLYRLAFRTYRADGVPGVSTARVYLPDTPHASPLPVIVIAHPSEGVADGCAPSKNASSLQDLALPWAARGYAVIAPDYAGLGNETTQGYLDNRDQAHSVLDGARALRRMLAPGTLSSSVVVFGHSQGGGATLSAQALASDYGADGTLAAVAVFAPQWPSRLNSFQLVDLLRQPDKLTILTGITNPVILQLLVYAYARNHNVDPAVLFPATKAAGVASAAESQCLQAFGAYVQGSALHLGDLTSAGMRAAFLACVDTPGSATCAGPGKALHDAMTANVLAGDAKGAPILYVQGMLDTIMPPASEAACNLAKLAADGVKPQVCTDATGIHTNVVVNNIVFAMKWAEARLAGESAPTCENSGMPACNP